MKAHSFEMYEKEVEREVTQFLRTHNIVTVEELEKQVDTVNAYEHLDVLQPISETHVVHLPERIDTEEAERAMLEGTIFWEHHAAGEGTRLGLGPKYTITLSYFSEEDILRMINDEREKDGLPHLSTLEENPKDLLPLSLGQRQILQKVFALRKLAKKYGKNPEEVLKKQSLLLVIDEVVGKEIMNEWEDNEYYGFDKKNVYFMIQKAFHGLKIENGKAAFDRTSQKRLHNHGQIFLQKTHDGVIFCDGTPLSSDEFEHVLEQHLLLVTYNIEGLDHLLDALDEKTIAFSLALGKKGYNMVMQVVGQNSVKPQKGGACFFDPVKNRAVIIESFQLKGIKNEEITHLNKNLNHYPNPANMHRAVKEQGLQLPLTVKEHNGKKHVYPCPVAGDVNFLVKTAYLHKHEKNMGWKSPATTPLTIQIMKKQDEQEGFTSFASSFF